MRTILLLLLLFISSSLKIVAQNFLFEHINEENGLSQINVSALHQDQNRFLWVGTKGGLFRYDGFTFEYIYEGNNLNQDAGILDISSNSKDLVALTEEKLIVFPLKSQKISFLQIPINRIQKNKNLLAIRNEILVGAENGLWSYQTESGNWVKLGIHDPITGIKKLKNGKIIISSVDGFYLYYPFSKKIKKINYQPNSFIKHMWVDPNQEIAWLEGDNYFHHGKIEGLNLFPKKSFLVNATLESNCLSRYKQHYILGTNSGLIIFDLNGHISNLSHQEGDLYSLTQNDISCVLQDQNSNLWVGTLFGGLNLFHPFRHKFELISPLVSTNYNNCKEIISFCEAADGNIIFQNSQQQLGIFDPKLNHINKLNHTGMIGNCIIPEPGSSNSYLIGSPKGLYRYVYGLNQPEFISTSNQLKNFEGDIKQILHEKDNQVWLAGGDGLFLFDLSLKQTLEIYGIGNSKLGSDNIRVLLRKSNNEIYIGTGAGLYLFNSASKDFDLVKINNNRKQPFITCLRFDSDGKLWIGTLGEGIYVFEKSGKIKILNQTNGLKNNLVYAMETDPKNNQIWISTQKGLSMIQSKNYLIENHELYSGLQGSEFIESASTRTKNGSIYFGGISGFNYFDPSNIVKDTNDTKIVVKSISTFNHKEDFLDYYRIPLEKNFVTFEFASLDYYLKGGHSYYYQMDGLQPEWKEIGDRRFESFAQLQAGDYTFKVKARNPDGKMGKQVAEISFSVVPPFYSLWWFKTIIFMLLAAFIAYAIYNRINKAIKEEQEKGIQNKQMAELELKALRAQMNPHFIFNSLNSIQDFVLNNEGQLAAKYLSKFAKLIRLILDISEQTFVSIQSKINFLSLYIELEALRLNNSFDYTIEVDPALDIDELIPTLIIQPHVENAIWHGLQYQKGEKKLYLKFKKIDSNLLEVIIEDNGIGRSVAMEIKRNKLRLHDSKGSKNTEDRISTLSRIFGSKPKIEIIDLFDENKLACGTKVIIQIPIIHG